MKLSLIFHIFAESRVIVITFRLQKLTIDFFFLSVIGCYFVKICASKIYLFGSIMYPGTGGEALIQSNQVNQHWHQMVLLAGQFHSLCVHLDNMLFVCLSVCFSSVFLLKKCNQDFWLAIKDVSWLNWHFNGLLFILLCPFVVVALSSLARIWGEGLTIHSPPGLFLNFYF